MGALPTHEPRGTVEDPPHHPAAPDPGVWLTEREPGELLGARRVVVHLHDCDPIVVGEVPTRQEAELLAEQVLERVEQAAARSRWVELGDRLVRPDLIVSVDVELAS